MARLKFVPKVGVLVPYPNRGAGEYHFAGRSPVVDPIAKTISNPADADPVEAEEGSDVAARFIQFVVRDACMHPADEATAKACGVQFVPVSRDADAEWRPTVAPQSNPVRKAAE